MTTQTGFRMSQAGGPAPDEEAADARAAAEDAARAIAGFTEALQTLMSALDGVAQELADLAAAAAGVAGSKSGAGTVPGTDHIKQGLDQLEKVGEAGADRAEKVLHDLVDTGKLDGDAVRDALKETLRDLGKTLVTTLLLNPLRNLFFADPGEALRPALVTLSGTLAKQGAAPGPTAAQAATGPAAAAAKTLAEPSDSDPVALVERIGEVLREILDLLEQKMKLIAPESGAEPGGANSPDPASGVQASAAQAAAASASAAAAQKPSDPASELEGLEGINKMLRDKLDLLEQEMKFVGMGPEARARERAELKAINELKEKKVGLEEKAAKEYVALRGEEAAREHRLKAMEAAWTAVEEIGVKALNDLDAAFATLFKGGEDSAKQFLDAMKNTLAEVASGLLRLAVINPLKNLFPGQNNPTLWALFSGGGQAQGAQAQGGSFFPNVPWSGNFMSGGNLLGNSAAINQFGHSVFGLSNGVPVMKAANGMAVGGGAASTGPVAAGVGPTLGSILGPMAGAAAGGFIGYQSGSPAMGAIGGIATGFALGGPPGAIAGAIAGLIGGGFGRSAQRRAERDRKEVERQQRIAQLVPALEQFYALAGEPMTGVGKMLADLTRQFQQLSSQAKELGLDTDLLADSFDKARQRIKDDFAKGIEDAILAFENDAELAFQNLEEAHRQRIREAIDAEADLDRVRHLNALELKRFFEGLSAEQIESLGQAVHLADLLEAKLRELGQSAAKEIDAQIQLAASAESTARQAAEAFRNLARTLQEAVHQLRTGNLSTLSARDRLAEQRGQFDQTASAALAGDQAALQRLPQLGQQLLEASMSYNGSTTAYATDFDRVMQVLRDAGVVAGGEAGRQQTQADVLHIQAELLRKIRDELANPEGPNAEILRGQLQTLGIIDGVLKGQSTVSVEQLAQLAGVSAGERTIAEQIAAGNSKIASLLEDFLQVQQQERLERQRKEAEEAARQARQAQIDARAATARGAAANLAGQIGGVRTAGATGNQELAVQMFKTMTGAVTGTASDRGSAQFDRADQLRVILSGFAQQLTAITGGTLPTDAAVFASTKYGSGYRIGSVNKAQSFGINDYVSIVSSFVRDAALQLAGITPQLRDAISQISWTNLPAAFDQLQRAVLDIRGFAAGTPSASPGWAWVGERGPELIRLRGGEEILPHDVSMRVTQAVPLPPLPRAAAANDRGVETRLEAIAAELKALRSEQERLMNAQIATAAEGARRVENAVEGNTAETRKVERAIDRQTQASLVA